MSEPLTGFPLSPQQRRLWALRQDDGGCSQRCLLRLQGIPAEAVELALRKIVTRHEILRTTFRRRPGIRFPIQVVMDEPSFGWEVEDLRGLPGPGQAERWEQRSGVRASLDLERGPLLQATLLRLSEGEHALLLELPELCADGGTLQNVARELGVICGLATAVGLPEEPLQYPQFSEWQTQLLEEEDGQSAQERWQALLANLPRGLELPFARRSQNPLGGGSAAIRSFLGAREAARIAHLARESGESSVEHFLLACWLVLLWRLTGSSDLTLSYLGEGRKFDVLAETLGPISRFLPLRCRLFAEHRLAEVVRVVEAAGKAALDDLEYFPEVDPPAPFSPFGFAFESWTASEFPGLRLDRRWGCFEPCMAGLAVSWSSDAIAAELRFDPDLLAREDAERLVGYFRQLVASALAEPERPIGELAILGQEERRLLLEAWSQSGSQAPTDGMVHELIEKRAKRAPEAIALVSEDAYLTYGELDGRADQLAHRLAARGVGLEDRVGLLLPRSPEAIVGLLGALKAGASYVPLDPALPRARLAALLSEGEIRTVLTREDLRDRVPAAGIEVLCADRWEASHPSGTALGQAVPENLAYVIFTSGSTGRPKGVGVEQRQIFHYIHAVRAALELPDGASYALVSTLAADLGNTAIFPALCFGGCLHVITEERARDPFALAEYFDRHRVDCLKIVPSHLAALEPFVQGRILPSARLILGGEASRIDWVEKLRRTTPGTTCEICNHYGPTETTVGALAYRLGPEQLTGVSYLPIGRPMGENRAYILDPDFQPVPTGVVAELFIGGAGVSRGYLGRPDLTGERFLPDPFGSQGERLYRTGDRARHLPGGEVEFLGRVDHQVKIHGFRVELGEIETVLTRHPAVREAVVVAYRSGDGPTRLAAYLTATTPTLRPQREELREFLRQDLPDPMIPAFFVTLDRLPLNPNGKVDRGALPSPAEVRPDLRREYVPPRTAVERALVGIWTEVLRLDQIGVNDNFFALGGDSLHSVQVLALAKEKGIGLALQDLFQRQTIAELAEGIEGRGLSGAVGASAESLPFCLISDEARRRLPAGIVDAFPLTHMQQAMLFHMQERPDSPAYHNVYSFHLRAPFHQDHLTEAVQSFVARYPMLRTSFALTEFGQPLQFVHAKATMELGFGDLRHLSFAEQETAIDGFVQGERTRLFDVRRPPLWRMHIHRRTDETFQFTMAECHPISDGWSTNATLAEIFAHYAARLKGEAVPELPPLALSYRDFVRLEQEALHSEECRRYWTDQIAEVSPLRLPRIATLRGERAVPQVKRYNFPLPTDLYQGLRRLAQQAEVPLKSLGLTAFVKVLSALTGEADVLTGLLVDGRPEERGGDQLRGLCLNSVPFRLRLADETWTDLARRTFASEQALYPYRRFPLSELQQPWGQETLLEAMFAYLNFRSLEKVANSADIEWLEYGNRSISETTFVLCCFFWVDPVPSEASIILTVDARVLDEESVQSIFALYREALERMVSRPSAHHGRSSILPAPELTQVLEQVRGAARDYPNLPYPRLFELQVERSPERVAASCRGDLVTYGELERRANRIAHALRARGIGTESVIALLGERGLDLLTSCLAVFKAGAAFLPLRTGDPVERYRQILSRSGAELLLVWGGGREAGEALASGPIPRVALATLAAEERSQTPPAVTLLPQNLAYMIFTSGSTGVPKGVMVEHRGMVNHLLAKVEDLDLTAADVVAQTAAQSFDISVWQTLAVLLAGGRVEVLPTEVAQDGRALFEAISRCGLSIMQIVPSMWSTMLRAEVLARVKPLDIASMRRIMLGGEPLPGELCLRWSAEFPDVPLMNAYGPSECSDTVSHHKLVLPPGPDSAVPIGMPLPNLRLYNLDRWLQPVPSFGAGDLYIGGVAVGRGYRDDPGRTALAFLPDPFANTAGERMYLTGDRVWRAPDGALTYLGRSDFQVKIRGVRIEPGEVEAVLSQHPGVLQAVVVARAVGQEGARLVAYFLPRLEPAPTERELRSFVRERLSEVMVPSDFVRLAEFPRLASGKVDRRSLPEPQWRTDAEASVAVPLRTPTEELLARLWAQLFKIERLSGDDDFFDLGGHSLLATRLIFQVRELFQVDLPLVALFHHPTISGFAQVIDDSRRQAKGLSALPIAPTQRNGPLAQSFAQHRLWLLERLHGNNPAYHLREVVRLKGPLDVPSLAAALSEVVRRHEGLRTTFALVDDVPVQIVHTGQTPELLLFDLSSLPAADWEEEVHRLAAEEARLPFDLEQGPVLRVRLVRLSDEEHVVFLTLHHIVADGWSLRVFLRELSALYEAFAQGSPSPLPTLPLQYSDFAVWQRKQLQTGAAAAQLEYWREKLAGAPPLLHLKTTRPRPARQLLHGRSYSFYLPESLRLGLEDLGRRESMTLFMLLLAGFKVLLHFYSDATDIVVGADVAGRDRSETADMIGFCVNELVLRSDLSGNPTFGELLGRVRQTCLEAYLHQDLPFVRLVEELKPERSPSYMPLFQVSLGLNYLPAGEQSFGELTLERLDFLRYEWARMDITLNIVHADKGLGCWVLYDADLFEPGTISRMFAVYEVLLERVVADPDVRLASLREALAEVDRELQEGERLELAEAQRRRFGRLPRRGAPSRMVELVPQPGESVGQTALPAEEMP